MNSRFQDEASDPSQAHQRMVESGYDRIAERYLANRGHLDPQTETLLEQLLEGMADSAPVLDLGCGAGVPITRWLAERRPTTGVDVSAHQVALAREHVPAATILKADMLTFSFPPATFGAVAAAYSIIHVPRGQHALLLDRIYQWLQPGGRFLATWPLVAWEGEDPNWEGWGTPMWWSHFDQDTNCALLRRCGFTIAVTELQNSQMERWLWIMARKPVNETG